MTRKVRHFYEFGSFRLDPNERLLLRDREPIRLSPKVTETLCLLVQNAGHLVEKEQLMKQVWPDVHVEEGNLNKHVFLLRKTLGQWDGGREYIETVSKRGFRFAAAVKSVEEEVAAVDGQVSASKRARCKQPGYVIGLLFMVIMAVLAGWQLLRHRQPPPNSKVATIRSLAVLPLENISGEVSQDYFADSMTDELITRLGQIHALRVISRSSAMQYKSSSHKSVPQIARELNVDAIVEGSVVRSGDRVRITAQLIHGAADKHIWAQSYEGNARDVLSLQRQIATAIAEQIQIQLTPQEQNLLKTEHVVNPEAYEDYLRGHYVIQTGAVDSYERSIVYFKQSLMKDPDNAPAYAGLAESYLELGHMVRVPPVGAFPEARKAALRSIELDESLAEAHLALANVKFLYDWDFTTADREFRRALELNPNSLNARADYADYLMAMGRSAESIAERKRNLQTDPLARRPIWALATGYYWAHHYDEAIAEARRAIDLDPNHWSGHLDLGLALEQKHQFGEAAAELRKAMAASENPIWVSFIAHDMALSGDRAGAEKIISHLKRLSKSAYVSPWLLAMIYPDLGENEKAIECLEKCYQNREHDLVFSNLWPMFDKLRPDPRYKDLIRRIGLPQP